MIRAAWYSNVAALLVLLHLSSVGGAWGAVRGSPSFLSELSGVASPGANGQEDWKTYRYPGSDDATPSTSADEQIAFSIPYPATWLVDVQLDVDPSTLVLVAFFDQKRDELSATATPRPGSADSNLAEAVFTVQVTSRSYEAEIEIASNNIGGDQRDVTVSGVSGREFRGARFPSGSAVVATVLPQGPFTYVLYGVLNVGENDYTDTVERMITSFAFS